MQIIQIIIIVFSIFALSRVLLNIKSRGLERLEGIFWTLFWLLAMFITIFPTIVVNLANILGVQRGVDLVIYSSIVILAYLNYRIYVQVTRVESKITKIVRTISIKKAGEKIK